MTRLFNGVSAPDTRRTAIASAQRSGAATPAGARAWFAAALLCSLAAGALPTLAQASGSLPIYQCISADGQSSRMRRTPCIAGETTGSVKNAVAAVPQQKPAIVQQAPSAPSAPVQAQDETQHRGHSTHRVGRRR